MPVPAGIHGIIRPGGDRVILISLITHTATPELIVALAF
jgi:hypothetical protein